MSTYYSELTLRLSLWQEAWSKKDARNFFQLRTRLDRRLSAKDGSSVKVCIKCPRKTCVQNCEIVWEIWKHGIDEGRVISFRGQEIWTGFKQDILFSLLSARCHFISLVMLHHRTFPPLPDRHISPPIKSVSILLPSTSQLHFLSKFLFVACNTFLVDPVYRYVRPRLTSHVLHMSLFPSTQHTSFEFTATCFDLHESSVRRAFVSRNM